MIIEPGLNEKLMFKLASLHMLLCQLEAANLCQGEHTIAACAPDGTARTLHVYVDGTDLQMHATAGGVAGFKMDVEAGQE